MAQPRVRRPALGATKPIAVLLFSAAVCLAIAGFANAQNEDDELAGTNDEPAFKLDCDLSAYSLKPRGDHETLNAAAETLARLIETAPKDSRNSLNYCVGDQEMYSWTNVPGRRPGGLRMGDLERNARWLVWDALRLLLSERAFTKVRQLAIVIQRASGSEREHDYTVAVFGNPLEDSAWGFQFDGHHIALNFLVHGNDLILAPMFIGAQPLEDGEVKPLESEIQLGRELYQSLNEEQQSKATVPGLVRNDVIAGSGSGHLDRGRNVDTSQFDDVGLPLSELSSEQMQTAKGLVQEYVFYLSAPFANELWAKLEPELTRGFFTYSQRGDRVYYRIYVKDLLLVEYDDVSEDHLHTVLRLLGPDGLNDYGPFALDDLGSDDFHSLSTHYRIAKHHAAND